ncbi:hypothetical protein F4824DRAFT_508274 [Ustulina deusta]|nr:hypothetical protein F4824DRAFT_508274 [Ustulina deusta]
MIEDFCRYEYVLYTDGVTYIGRLPFLQMCGSVLLTPPVAWRQLTTHLLWPVFSRDLVPTGREMPEGVRNAWPTRYGPDDANVVFVAPDWSGLEDMVLWLGASRCCGGHREEAEGSVCSEGVYFLCDGDVLLAHASEGLESSCKGLRAKDGKMRLALAGKRFL